MKSSEATTGGEAYNSVPAAERAYSLLANICSVRDSVEREARVASLRTVSKPFVISFLNAHAFNLSWKNAAFADSLCHSDILLRDGIGISLMMRALNLTPGFNMNGTDLIPYIVTQFAGKRIAVCGTQEPYLTKAAGQIQGLGGKVVLTMDGFLDAGDYVEGVRKSSPDLVILGMGMPKQESVAMLLARQLSAPVVIMNGGAILDFWAGRFPRAAPIWQKLRLEWLFRLIQEPRRLWRRYILGGIVFVIHMLQLWISSKRYRKETQIYN
jgi:exopolysaccharide biosynthesis WecB/TagA/CpsF family protein